jgi:hypothetical protein
LHGGLAVVVFGVRQIETDDIGSVARIASVNQVSDALASADGAESLGDDVGVAEVPSASLALAAGSAEN